MKTPAEHHLFKNIILEKQETVLSSFQSQDFDQSLKNDNSVVTSVDKHIDQLITGFIQKHFSQDQIVSEETYSDFSSLDQSQRTWFIDPICGTRNFATGVKLFTTNIGLWHENKPIYALVFDYLEETYYWMHQDVEGVRKENKITRPPGLSKPTLILETGRIQHKGNEDKVELYCRLVKYALTKDWTYKRLGSSLDACYTALGKYNSYICPIASPWDFAAAAALMYQNQGYLTDLNGNQYSPFSNSLCMAQDKKIHDELLKVVAEKQ